MCLCAFAKYIIPDSNIFRRQTSSQYTKCGVCGEANLNLKKIERFMEQWDKDW